MQVVILAGGFGIRLSEETDLIPKPMIRIGGLPILLHIMKYYAKYGHNDFIIATGYKSEIIREYFDSEPAKFTSLSWNISVIDTGLRTLTGGRIKQLEKYLDQEFMLTYGDGLSNINLDDLLDHHKRFGKLATVTAVRPPARFGTIEISNGLVTKFAEKDPLDSGWINGGFFCLNRRVCQYILDDSTTFELEPLIQLTATGQLSAFEHHGWWQPMDTPRDKRLLESIWEEGIAPWL